MLIDRYIWLLDVIREHGRITRAEIDELWLQSPFSHGNPLPRRTFMHYRNAIEDLFKVNIQCDPATYEYFIDTSSPSMRAGTTEWLLNSAAMSGILTNLEDASDRVFLEEVPSAREHLGAIVKALKSFQPIAFDYFPYTRSRGTRDVTIEPYFLKIFRQRWYVTGRNVKEDKIKTYALDRMRNAHMVNSHFTPDADFNPRQYVNDAFGVIYDNSAVKDVQIKVPAQTARYLRDLPLHHSQQETVHDQYSIFSYKLKITWDFVQELLSRGSSVTVLSPPELRNIITTELQKSLANYGTP